jgi:hypothetical protein
MFGYTQNLIVCCDGWLFPGWVEEYCVSEPSCRDQVVCGCTQLLLMWYGWN